MISKIYYIHLFLGKWSNLIIYVYANYMWYFSDGLKPPTISRFIGGMWRFYGPNIQEHCEQIVYDLIIWVFPKIGVTPKLMVYNGKPYKHGWFGGTHNFWKHPYSRKPSYLYPLKWLELNTVSTTTSSAPKVNTTPLIFILSPGTDPVSDVITFADKTLGLGSGKLLWFQIVFFSNHQLILESSLFFFHK